MRVEAQSAPAEFVPFKHEGVKVNRDSGKKESTEPIKISVKELKPTEELAPEMLQDAVKTANNAIRITNSHLQFRLHEGSGRYHIKVIDTNTDEVIREIPPESVLEFSANIKKMLDEAVGVLVDELV